MGVGVSTPGGPLFPAQPGVFPEGAGGCTAGRAAQFTLAAALVVLTVLAYAPFLPLPLLSDDHTVLLKGHKTTSLEGWRELLADPLYRCRATFLVLLQGAEKLLGDWPAGLRSVSVLLHLLNVALIVALGSLRPFNHWISIPAAVFFAVHEGHQEAVVWTSAMPELLVFLFAVAGLLLWARWLEGGQRNHALLAALAACYLLALYSKESAVAVLPFFALLWWPHRRKGLLAPSLLGGMLAAGLTYAFGSLAAGQSNYHLNDGTFRFNAPFWITIPHSMVRILWFWGVPALAAIWWLGSRRDRRLAGLSLLWMAATVSPYSFLDYMTRVPSRHTYLASAGLALLAGLAFAALRRRGCSPKVLALVTLAVVLHNTGYLWVKKLPQYHARAAALERFLDFAAGAEGPILVQCAPFPPSVFRDALRYRSAGAEVQVVGPTEAGELAAAAIPYCDSSTP